MNSEEKTELLCHYCKKEITDIYNNFTLIIYVNVKKRMYWINLDTILYCIGEYTKKDYIHLSPSQILILRGDIVAEMLSKMYEEKVIWGIYTAETCDECYEIYKQQFPMR